MAYVDTTNHDNEATQERNEVTAYLILLGHPNEIAPTLINLGVRGFRNSCTVCPIAVALNAKFSSFAFNVDRLFIGWYSKEDPLKPLNGVVPPGNIRDFIRMFDTGSFAELSVT